MVAATGCNNNKEVSDATTPKPPPENMNADAPKPQPGVEGEVITTPKEERTDLPVAYKDFPDSLFASIERTPCFGQCPIYTIKVYNSGYATYEGKKFTPREGLFEGRVDESIRQKIAEKALAIGYYELKEEYDGPVTDLPSVITRLNLDGKKKQVKARFQAPDELRGYEKYMDELLSSVKWNPVEGD